MVVGIVDFGGPEATVDLELRVFPPVVRLWLSGAKPWIFVELARQGSRPHIWLGFAFTPVDHGFRGPASPSRGPSGLLRKAVGRGATRQ